VEEEPGELRARRLEETKAALQELGLGDDLERPALTTWSTSSGLGQDR
jgi:hypothetical protein